LTLDKLFTHNNFASVTKQYNLVPVNDQRAVMFAAGKVTAGLTPHSPCVTDTVVMQYIDVKTFRFKFFKNVKNVKKRDKNIKKRL